MEKRPNYNKEVDDLTKINEFFQNAEVPIKYTITESQKTNQIHVDTTKSA